MAHRNDDRDRARPGYGFRERWRGGPGHGYEEPYRGYGRPTPETWAGEQGQGYESWRQQGPFSGRGPQGYQRSSESIHEEACELLTRHGLVDASKVRVTVEDGEITLEGTVSSRREKRIAEDAVESISGVRDVHNHLRVEREGGEPGAMASSPGTRTTNRTGSGGTSRRKSSQT
jgi:hypothetical protein